ncbi:uncharacterized protein LOC143027730 [Oratosquilla oratoria]|uniref:uncharacterized protein LOC143027730 n=1 Tax=Oratosquilla oratoria TaxID=337810 RepID=UPI003F76EC44
MAVGGGAGKGLGLGGKGSLRDVLIAGGSSVGGSGPPPPPPPGSSSHGKGLTWRSLRSVSAEADGLDPRGHFFPDKLAMGLGIFKLFLALVMVVLGGTALVLDAALANLGAGIWAGVIAGVSGFLGICAARRPYANVYVVSFMSVAILSMAGSGLLIILSATAWARDSQKPSAVFVDQITNQEIEGLGEVHLHRPSAIVSAVLVLVGVIECLVSLACITISAREACGLHTKGAARLQGLSEGHNRKERLYRWLGQQKTIFPLASSQPPPRAISSSVSAFVPLSSDSSSNGTPRKNSDPSALSSSTKATATNTSNASNLTQKTSSTHLTPTTQASGSGIKNSGNVACGGGGGGRTGKVAKPSLKTSKTPRSGSAGTQHVHYGPNSLPVGPHHHQQQPCPVHHFPPPHPHPHAYPHPHPYGPMALQHPPYGPPPAAHPSMYYPHLVTPMLPHDPRPQEQQQQQRPSHLARKDLRKKKDRKLRYKMSKKEEKKKKKKKKKAKKELTDEQIERTYTGLDREIAEGFINTAMEPALSINRAFGSSFEDEEEDSF